jgi:hypothetical protein
MAQNDRPLETRAFDPRGSEAEAYVAIARGFKSLEEFRAFRKAREYRGNVSDCERRLTVLKIEVR